MAAATLVVGGLALVGATSTGASGVTAGAVRVAAQTGSMGAGRHVTAPTSSKPYVPTKAEQTARDKQMADKAALQAPSFGRHTTSADVKSIGGAQTSPERAPGDFMTFKNSTIPASCASSCAQSAINEPEVANAGKRLLETSNWNIAYSNDGGGTWAYQNPYTLFGPSFCCDQEVLYEPNHDRFIYLGLDAGGTGSANNALVIATAPSQSSTSWCTYHFYGNQLGGVAGELPDFPKIAIANNYLFVTWNAYATSGSPPPWVRTGIARIPLEALANCAGFSYLYLTRTDNFTFALSQGALDTFYWVSNWYPDGSQTNGATMRIYKWADNSATIFFFDRAVNAYTFGNVSCGSPNWCSRLDPRYESVVLTRAEFRGNANAAFSGDTLLEVSTSAGPSGFSNGKNYVVYNYFKLNSLTYIGNDETFSTTESFAYPGCNVNRQGHVGCAMSHGTNVPGGLLVLQDDVSPTQPWGFCFCLGGIGTATAWGDYQPTNPFEPGVGPFISVLWRVNGSNVVEPHVFIFGRGHDNLGYKRWKGK
jgi:hypothetical protein